MKTPGKIYFTFPISIFQNGFQDMPTAANDAILYGCYAIARTLLYNDEASRMRAAANQMDIVFGDDEYAYDAGEELYDRHHGTPMTSIAASTLHDYKEHKTEFQVASLLAFAAVRSILQTKAYCKTNKGHIHARMCGCASVKKLPNKLSEEQQKYTKRWHMDKVLRELEHNWGLKTFSNHTRGIYIAFDKVDYETLAKLNEEKKIKVKETKLKQVKADALSAARLKLGIVPEQPINNHITAPIQHNNNLNATP